MKTDKHLWRTMDGRLVRTGHPAAEILAYPAGTTVSDRDAERIDDTDPADLMPGGLIKGQTLQPVLEWHPDDGDPQDIALDEPTEVCGARGVFRMRTDVVPDPPAAEPDQAEPEPDQPAEVEQPEPDPDAEADSAAEAEPDEKAAKPVPNKARGAAARKRR